MLIVIPRAFSSGALSIWSYARNSASAQEAAVLGDRRGQVVFPWSMCPIVPTFRCGLFRSNFCFPIRKSLLEIISEQKEEAESKRT
jgi:hypothetical protein